MNLIIGPNTESGAVASFPVPSQITVMVTVADYGSDVRLLCHNAEEADALAAAAQKIAAAFRATLPQKTEEDGA